MTQPWLSPAFAMSRFLQQGRLEEAVTAAGGALDFLGGVHSERSVQALRDFRGRLAPFRAVPVVWAFERRARPVLGVAA
ncbi:hypothetical protein [Streptomyces hoynatensis]|uniref:hypothetical protein n=1 Tax=Streptomyces hoynatensis TaxID=1141874 RepID=UPI0011C4AC23